MAPGWILTHAPVGLNGAGQQQWNTIQVNGNVLQTQFAAPALGGSNVNFQIYAIPYTLINPSVAGKSQFSEVTFGTDSSSWPDVNQIGPAVVSPVMNKGGAAQNTGYTCILTPGGGGINNGIVVRSNTAGSVTNSLITGMPDMAPGDVWRLEVRVTGAGNIVTVKQNGTIVGGPTTDSTVVTAPLVFYPGTYFYRLSTTPQTTQITLFNGGIL